MLIVAMLDLYNPHFLTHQTIGVGAGGTERWHLTGKAKLLTESINHPKIAT